jgi:hypothetical protein
MARGLIGGEDDQLSECQCFHCLALMLDLLSSWQFTLYWYKRRQRDWMRQYLRLSYATYFQLFWRQTAVLELLCHLAVEPSTRGQPLGVGGPDPSASLVTANFRQLSAGVGYSGSSGLRESNVAKGSCVALYCHWSMKSINYTVHTNCVHFSGKNSVLSQGKVSHQTTYLACVNAPKPLSPRASLHGPKGLVLITYSRLSGPIETCLVTSPSSVLFDGACNDTY